MSPADFEAAIREGGVAVERNIGGFGAGLEAGDAVAVTEARASPARGPRCDRSARRRWARAAPISWR